MSVLKVEEFVEVSRHTTVDWYHFCHEITSAYLGYSMHRPLQNGVNYIVEVDKSLIRMPKHHYGSPGQPICILGLLYRELRNVHLKFMYS